MNRFRVSLLSCLFVTILVSLFQPSGVSKAAASTCGVWNVVSTPSPSNYNILNGVVSISSNNIWAVGVQADNSGYQTLIEHWNGTKWLVVSSPNNGPNGSWLNGVTAISASNIWAVGYYFNTSGATQGLIEHWNGTKWRIVSSPSIGIEASLSAVTAISARNIWAVGYYYQNGSLTLIEHWNGFDWQIVSSPNVVGSSNSLNSIAAVSSSNIWTVGMSATGQDVSSQQALIEHWDGSSWNIVASPPTVPSGNGLNGVTAISANNIWAVGYALNSAGNFQTLIEQWNGSNWSIVTSPNNGISDMLYGMATISANNIWGVGYDDASSSGPFQTLIEHWDGTNWSIVASPNPTGDNFLFGVTRVLGTIKVWAVGENRASNSGPTKTLAEFNC